MKKIILCIPMVMAGCFDADQSSTEFSTTAKKGASDRVAHGTSFENVSSKLAPFSRSANGEGLGGVAMLDYDQDGDLDIYLSNGVFSINALFSNNGDGTFDDVTLAAGVHNGFGTSGIVVGDIDNDGYPDMFLSGEGRIVGPQQTPTRLYHNNGDKTFTEISVSAGVAAATSEFGASMGDVNGDGYLDIFVTAPGHIPFMPGTGPGESPANKLFINNQDLTFTEVGIAAGVGGQYLDANGVVRSEGACVSSFMDYDADGDQDILVGNCNAYWFTPPPLPMPVRPTPFTLYSNNFSETGVVTFSDVTAAAGLQVLGFWMGLAVGDVDNDGDEDFFATSLGNFGPVPGMFPHVLMINNGDGTFSNDVASGLGATEFGWGATMADFDNDGDLDLFQVGALPLFGAIGPGAASPGRLSYNNGDGTWSDGTSDTSVNLSFDKTSGTAQGDIDGDGFADLIVVTAPWTAPDGSASNPNGAPVLLRNLGNENNSVNFRLVSADGSTVVGAKARVKVGQLVQYRTQRAGSSMGSTNSPWMSVGVGERDHGDVKVYWPSGLVEEFTVGAGALVTLAEGTGAAQ